METEDFYLELKRIYLSNKNFKIRIKCSNKKDLIFKSRLLFDIFQDIKSKYPNYSKKYSLLYLSSFWGPNDFNCQWTVCQCDTLYQLKLI